MADRDLVDEALKSWARERPDLKVQPVAVVMRALSADEQADLRAGRHHDLVVTITGQPPDLQE
jgi:hypothetical protein